MMDNIEYLLKNKNTPNNSPGGASPVTPMYKKYGERIPPHLRSLKAAESQALETLRTAENLFESSQAGVDRLMQEEQQYVAKVVSYIQELINWAYDAATKESLQNEDRAAYSAFAHRWKGLLETFKERHALTAIAAQVKSEE